MPPFTLAIFSPSCTAPRHDAAEANLIGLWGVIEQGRLGGLSRKTG